MPTAWKRDLEADGKKFEAWLRGKLPDARELNLSPLVQPTSSGFSNETLLFDLRWLEGGEKREEALVVRIQPIGYQIFPEYDLSFQFRSMDLLRDTQVPVPKMWWMEQDGDDVFGAPFYVMSQVKGRVPPDNPPYHTGGWVTEASPKEREEIWLSCFDCMAKLHRLDVSRAGFDFVKRPKLGANGLDQELAYYDEYWRWASAGRSHPVLEPAREWLEANKPTHEDESIVWGDARIGNMIFDGSKPSAVIDWEMVNWGSGEKDVGWAIFLDRHHSEGMGVPRLEGFPSYDDSLAYYAEKSGRTVKNLHYYQVYAGWRFGIVMLRIAQQVHHYGLMDAEQSREMELNNTVTRLAAKLLDLAPPGEIPTSGGYA